MLLALRGQRVKNKLNSYFAISGTELIFVLFQEYQ